MIVAFTVLTIFLTTFVILTWEQLLRPPFFAWTERRYPYNAERRATIQQRVEHFFISMTVDLIVVSLLLRLVGRQQRELIGSEKRYRALFEHASDGIGVVNAGDFKLVEANNKFCEIFSCPPQGLIGRDIRQLLRADATPDALTALLRSDASEESEMEVETSAGTSLPVAVSSSAIATDSERLIMLIVRDLSARKRLEAEKAEIQQQLFQTSKLASIGELSAGVAHEINNPLNGLINFAQLLQDEETDRPEFDRQMIQGIIDEGSRIAAIVRGLLTFARHDSQELRRTSISDIINTSISLFGRQLEKDGIRVEVDVEENLPNVRADGSRLRQVVVNMISNAHHALKSKQSDDKLLRISARRAVRNGGEGVLRLEFFDNGVGVRREVMNRLFDPFFTTRRDTGGTGLGLSISFGIIRDHGGTITVESEEREFTRFIAELPFGEEAGEAMEYV
jgi:PAS domain S-box-containing protein